MSRAVNWEAPSKTAPNLTRDAHARLLYEDGATYVQIAQAVGVTVGPTFQHLVGMASRTPGKTREERPHYTVTCLQLAWEGSALELEKGEFKRYEMSGQTLADKWESTHDTAILENVWLQMMQIADAVASPSQWAYEHLRCDLYELLIDYKYITRHSCDLGQPFSGGYAGPVLGNKRGVDEYYGWPGYRDWKIERTRTDGSQVRRQLGADECKQRYDSAVAVLLGKYAASSL